jgi:Methyltransferase domain
MRRFVELVAQRYSRRARQRRARLFNELLRPKAEDRILDLGSEDGTHIAQVVPYRSNVTIADISGVHLASGAERYGFQTLLLDETGRIPVADGYFDVVFCSSVIEHVTVDKDESYSISSGDAFARAALRRQRCFADEIRRVGRSYFVQTPNRYFLMESHTWLPGIVGVLPRRALLRLIPVFNRFWPKQTSPDWNLLTGRELAAMFPEAEILREKSLGVTKSLIAVKTERR